ncbi:MAG: hypothetical protein HIU92_18530 [Proteobacteria bacterium]|nr:hypothetical protein [Pseudomonadota bacterium]
MTEGVSSQLQLGERALASPAPSIWRLISRQAVPIVPFNQIGGDPPIYCVHPIAGDVSTFQTLADALRSAQRFFGIQVPQSKMNAEFCTTIQDVARHHVAEVCRFQPEGPLILAGWSAGAIIALEMAQQLAAAGRDVPLLIALDGAPCNTGAGLRRGTPRYLWQLACNFPGWLRSEVRESPSPVSFVRRMIKRAKLRLKAKIPSIRTEQTLDAEAVLQVLDNQGWRNQQRLFIRSLFQASRNYVPKPYRGRVLVYEAKIQPLDHLLQVGAAWRQIAPQAEIVRLEGTHQSIFRSPDVAVMAEHLLARLADLRLTLPEHSKTAFPVTTADA